MYKVKMFSCRDLGNIERNLNFFVESNGLTDWEMVGNVNVTYLHDSVEYNTDILYVATIRYWEGNNR